MFVLVCQLLVYFALTLHHHTVRYHIVWYYVRRKFPNLCTVVGAVILEGTTIIRRNGTVFSLWRRYCIRDCLLWLYLYICITFQNFQIYELQFWPPLTKTYLIVIRHGWTNAKHIEIKWRMEWCLNRYCLTYICTSISQHVIIVEFVKAVEWLKSEWNVIPNSIVHGCVSSYPFVSL